LPDFGVKCVYVLADTRCASEQIICTVWAKGFRLVSFLKSNRQLVINGHRTSVSKFLKRSFLKTRKRCIGLGKARYATVQQECHLPGLGDVSVVFSQKKGRRTALPLFATDSTLATKGDHRHLSKAFVHGVSLQTNQVVLGAYILSSS